ncbi:myosin D, putative [Plasmodium vinckei petteri]|uniref:Myosin D, putative n=1 Tax=Plasmodium vinckei petteri TaxID=138298 RepID=A0A6V7TFV5_PLAVN|nr:myosin D, putative [Plasmodium vinckei petteri]
MSFLHMKSNETVYHSNVSNIKDEGQEQLENDEEVPKDALSLEQRGHEEIYSNSHVWYFHNNSYKKMEVLEFKKKEQLYTLKRKGKIFDKIHKDQVIRSLKNELKMDNENSVDIIQLNEVNVIQNLKNRYGKNKIYTFHASLLLAINPYKQLKNLYDVDIMNDYLCKFKNTNSSEKNDCKAHIYDIGNMAYKNMVLKRKRQTIVVSGHSGSGKTENCKFLFKYFHYIFFHKNSNNVGKIYKSMNSYVNDNSDAEDEEAKKNTTTIATNVNIEENGDMSRYERIDKLIYINNILESMSNAKTIKNNNSSRCGRINELIFEEKKTDKDIMFNHCFSNIKILILLLEINRCITQNDGERNFHVFYQTIWGLNDEDLSKRNLVRDVKVYKLLNNDVVGYKKGSTNKHDEKKNDIFEKNKQKDEKNFEYLLKGLNYIKYDKNKINNFFDIIAGIIHLGEIVPDDSNVTSNTSNHESNIENPFYRYKCACDCLKIDIEDLKNLIKYKNIQVSNENIKTPRTKENSLSTLHTLIKVIYKKLFNKIINDINMTNLSDKEKKEMLDSQFYEKNNSVISILDLYGFEELSCNDFEQLCINLANEKLNNYYINNEIEKEKNIYKEENILWSDLVIPSYEDTIIFIEKIFGGLDDITKLNNCGHKKVDDNFFTYLLNNENKYLEKHIYGFINNKDNQYTSKKQNIKKNKFFIKHYAGHVTYSINNWIHKNSDKIEAEIEDLINTSENVFLNESIKDEANEKDITESRKVSNTSVGLASNNSKKNNILSVSKKYIKELDNLFTNLEKTDMYYIRCVLPNERMECNNFKKGIVYSQLKECGANEMIKIINNGLSHKILKKELIEKLKKCIAKELIYCNDNDIIYYIMRLFDEDKFFKIGKKYIFMKSNLYTQINFYMYDNNIINDNSLVDRQTKKDILRDIRIMRFKRCVTVVKIFSWINNYYIKYLTKKKIMKEKACDYMYKIYLIRRTILSVKKSLSYNVKKLNNILCKKAYQMPFNKIKNTKKKRKNVINPLISIAKKETVQHVSKETKNANNDKIGSEEKKEKVVEDKNAEKVAKDEKAEKATTKCEENDKNININMLCNTGEKLFVCTPDNYHYVYNNLDWIIIYSKKKINFYNIFYSYEQIDKKHILNYNKIAVKKIDGDTKCEQWDEKSNELNRGSVNYKNEKGSRNMLHNIDKNSYGCISQHPLYKNLIIGIDEELNTVLFTYPNINTIRRFIKKKIKSIKKSNDNLPNTYLPQLYKSRKYSEHFFEKKINDLESMIKNEETINYANEKMDKESNLFDDNNLNMFMHMYKNVYVLSTLDSILSKLCSVNSQHVDNYKTKENINNITENNNKEVKTDKKCFTYLKGIKKEDYISKELYTNETFKVLKISFLSNSINYFVYLSYALIGENHYLLLTIVNLFSKPVYTYTIRIDINNIIKNDNFVKFFIKNYNKIYQNSKINIPVNIKKNENINFMKNKECIDKFLSTIKMSIINNSHIFIHGCCILSLVEITKFNLNSGNPYIKEYEYKYLQLKFNLYCFEYFNNVYDTYINKLSHDLKHQLVINDMLRNEEKEGVEKKSKLVRLNCSEKNEEHNLSCMSNENSDNLFSQENDNSGYSFYIFSLFSKIYLLTNKKYEPNYSEVIFNYDDWKIFKLKSDDNNNMIEDENKLCSFQGILNMNINYYYKQNYYKSHISLNSSIQATIQKYDECFADGKLHHSTHKYIYPDVYVLRIKNSVDNNNSDDESFYYNLKNQQMLTLCTHENKKSSILKDRNCFPYSVLACTPLNHLDTILLLNYTSDKNLYFLEFVNIVNKKKKTVPIEE